jgi:DNA replication protein DnaC
MSNKGPQPRTVDQISPVILDALMQVFNGSNPWPLFITGSVGIGKSCAAMAMIDHLQVSRRYSKSNDFVSDTMKASRGELVRGSFTHSSESFSKDWAEASITCIDEMGSREKVADWPRDIIQDLIDARGRRPSIWISNLALDDLALIYGNRIVSRLSEGTQITMTGTDRRLKGTL